MKKLKLKSLIKDTEDSNGYFHPGDTTEDVIEKFEENFKLVEGKINKIIDYCHSLFDGAYKLHKKHEDRLKTLEDFVQTYKNGYCPVCGNNMKFGHRTNCPQEDAKVKFIMDNTSPNIDIHNLDMNAKSLQDLWDEENKMTEFKFNPPVEVKTGVEYEVRATLKEVNEILKNTMEDFYPNEAKIGEPTVNEKRRDCWREAYDVVNKNIWDRRVVKPTVKENVAKPFTDTNLPTVKECDCVDRGDCCFCPKCKPTDKSEKIEEDYFDKMNREIREQIRDLKIQNANLDDYFINNNKVVKGKPDVKTGRLYGLDCGYIDGSRDKKIEEIISDLSKWYYENNKYNEVTYSDFESWLRDKLKEL